MRLAASALAWALLWALTLILPARALDAGAGGLKLEQVGPGVYVYWGPHEEAGPANQGAIANVGVVLGERCVAVIDSGGSLAFGQRLRRAIMALTPKPVCALINTHLHPDHLLGNGAFAEAGIAVYGHARLPQSLASRAQSYLAAAQREVGLDLVGSELHAPRERVAGAQWLDLGQRRLLLQAQPLAHTATDLTVIDESTRTLFAGDLVFVEHVPVVDGSVRGWLSVLEGLAGQDFAQVVPGHGPLVRNWPAALMPQTAYLGRLLDGTRRALDQGQGLQQAMDAVAAQNLERWLRFDAFHRRNVAAVYTELEWE
ncbi:MAG: quinoprotein relay system zinc metallohydrolase 2 [Betaproteobacteria bacterium]